MQHMTDLDLINACLVGDNSCFEELVARYKNLVYSVILRMINDTEEANDLAQEVFIKVYKNLSKYSDEYKFSTWVIRITTNHVIDYRRKNKHEVVSMDAMDAMGYADKITKDNAMAWSGSAYLSPENEIIQKEQNEEITGAVSKLPDMYRIPIVLYHQKGLSYQEIANVIDEPLSKVKNRIFRGRKILREWLLYLGDGEGGTYGLQ